MRENRILSLLRGKFGSQSGSCPSEADLLAYLESTLEDPRRTELEPHLASCQDCCEVLAVVSKVKPSQAPLPQNIINAQVERVREYAELDHQKRINSTSTDSSSSPAARPRRSGIALTYPQLAAAALIVCTVGLAAVFWITRDEPRENSAMRMLKLAQADGRRTQGWLSGLDVHAPYAVTRGPNEQSNVQFETALNKLKSAEVSGSPASERLVLARVLVAGGRLDQIARAIGILNELIDSRALPERKLPEAYNDRAVAQMELGNYEGALDSANQALSLRPDYPQATFNKGLALERTGRNSEARAAFEKAIQTTSDNGWKSEIGRRVETLDSEAK
jgi:tetratricopeptide (TPR) repeat protein